MIPCPVKGKSSGLRLSAAFIWQRGFAVVNARYDHGVNILNEQKMYVLMHFWVRTNCICILLPDRTKGEDPTLLGTTLSLISAEFTWMAPSLSSFENTARSPALSVSLELIWAGDEAFWTGVRADVTRAPQEPGNVTAHVSISDHPGRATGGVSLRFRPLRGSPLLPVPRLWHSD